MLARLHGWRQSQINGVERFTERCVCPLKHGGNVVRPRTRLLEIANDDFPLLHAGWILPLLLHTAMKK